MTGPESVPRPKWSSTLAVRLNLLMAILLLAITFLLGVVVPGSCADLCLAAGIAGLLIGPTFGLLVGLVISGVWGRSIGLALIDVALTTVIVGLSVRTILAVDIQGMLAISVFAAAPFVGGVLATREAAHGRLERRLMLGGLIALAIGFAITPAVQLGAVVPIVVLPALAFPMVPPWPYGKDPEPSAALVKHGDDREE
jgi:hypothetical protein